MLIAHLAAVTERIRVGSGGVMLPNHQPLVIAEQFGTLDALHPGRIDLGIGRAPGTDQRTARALRRGTAALGADDFPEQLGELMAYFRGDGPVAAVPAQGQDPAVWLLGSSGYSAQLAGLLGLPFAFAHHFSGENTLPALELYRKMFRPSEVLARAVRDDRRVRAVRAGRRRGPAARAAVGAAVPAAASRQARPGADAGGGGRVPVQPRGARVRRAPAREPDHRLSRDRARPVRRSWSSGREWTS